MRTKKTSKSSIYFLIAIALYIYSPLTALPSMYGMVGDTAIQIKLGLDGITAGHMILDEIYSWHPGLVFTSHESLWYMILGFMYKYLGLWGVVLVGTLFIFGTVALIIRNLVKEKVHPLIVMLVLVLTPFLTGFPDYNVRPSVTSTFALVLVIYVFMSGMSKKSKIIIYTIVCFALGWLHGGIVPIFSLLALVFAVIELLYKRFRESLTYFIALLSGFVSSLINPIGIRGWTFGFKQTGATDVWATVGEWQPHVFSILEIVMLLLLFIGFMADPRVKMFDKKTITKIALICMFFVATTMYTRFNLQLTVLFLMFAPEEFSVLIGWINEHIFKVKKPVEFSDASFGILTLACIVLIAFTAVTYVPKYFVTNTMEDVEVMAAYDHELIEFLELKDYKRPFNGFNSGSWLAFYDIPVHIDNRIDPYMREYSEVDHIRGRMSVNTLADLDSFMNKYDADAFIIDMDPSGSDLLYEIAMYAPDRYKIVYDNTCISNITDNIAVRWVVIEPCS